MPGQRAVARAGICICRGAIVLTHLALVAGAGGVQQLGVSDVRPHAGRGGQEASKGRRFKSISPSAACPTRGPKAQQSLLPGSTAGLWATGTGLHRSALRWGSGHWGGLCGRGSAWTTLTQTAKFQIFVTLVTVYFACILGLPITNV